MSVGPGKVDHMDWMKFLAVMDCIERGRVSTLAVALGGELSGGVA